MKMNDNLFQNKRKNETQRPNKENFFKKKF